MTATTDKTPRLFVFVGPVQLTKGNGVAIREINEAGEFIADSRFYKAIKELKHRTIGAIYKINANDTTIDVNTIQFVKMHPDQDFVTRSRVAGDIFEMRQRITKLEKAADTTSAIDDAIEPLRRIYAGTDVLGKRCIEAMLLDALRRGIR